MKQINKEAVKYLFEIELARRSFWRFCLFYDKDFFKKRSFLQQVAEAFQKVEENEINALSVSLPPRAGKSYITSLFCAWTLGRNPTESIMRNTCTATLYLKFSYDVRNILMSDKFKKVFTEVRISNDKANLQGWNTNQSRQVGYFGAGVGGTIIGFGATKLAITDDLYRGLEDALSETQNERILQWKEATHDSRIERNCKKIDIGTRWSKNDVIGQNYDKNRYDLSIVISALDENDKSFCEDVLTTEQYLDIKERINPDIWLAEYMQEPVDLKGKLFTNLKTINFEDFKPLLNGNEGGIAYIDVSDQGADFTAMVIGLIIKNEVFIVDYVFTRDNTDLTIPLCSQKLQKWGVKWCRVESNSMGAMFSRELQRLTPKTQILQVNNQANKITRIIMQSATILNSFNFVLNGSFEQKQFIENMTSFSKEGKNKHDDAPDCTAGLSMFVSSMFPQLKL